MPRIFDNIEEQLLPALRQTPRSIGPCRFLRRLLQLARLETNRLQHRTLVLVAKAIVAVFWSACSAFLRMKLHDALSLVHSSNGLDNQTAVRFKKRRAEEFRDQLTYGAPNNEDEAGLRRLVAQIRARKVIVKLFLRHTLHAKLYLLFRPDPINPEVAFLGSSNLTWAGLQAHGELNVDVMDRDACRKLARWFEERWTDLWCLDISDELANVIDESWARKIQIPPYHIYVKIAYHLCQMRAKASFSSKFPGEFRNQAL